MTVFDDAGPVRIAETPAEPVPDATLEQLARGGAALVVDQGLPDCLWLVSDMRPLGELAGRRLCGPVLTVNAPPGDNVALRAGIDQITPGQVLLVAGKGYLGRALIGEILAHKAVANGVAGILIDGAVRDAASLAGFPVPVYSRGSALTRALKLGYGEVGFPVAVANEVVYPGDVVVADEDGIAVVRREAAVRVGASISSALEYEADRLGAAIAGTLDLGVRNSESA